MNLRIPTLNDSVAQIRLYLKDGEGHQSLRELIKRTGLMHYFRGKFMQPF